MNVCESCGRPLPRPVKGISDQELNVLSAWWHYRSTKAVARFYGRSEQTVKNQLNDARRRNGFHTTSEMAEAFMPQLRTIAELTMSQNMRQKHAA